ncbi:hypothetical protein GW17_00036245 [Ensete ventricosum]|nr:hypothetical protein GW17_00036245 [Ensete ventricosum]
MCHLTRLTHRWPLGSIAEIKLTNTDDFEDFCSRASKLADKSNGAPLFTVAQNRQPAKLVPYDDLLAVDDSFTDTDDPAHEDEWQIL